MALVPPIEIDLTNSETGESVCFRIDPGERRLTIVQHGLGLAAQPERVLYDERLADLALLEREYLARFRKLLASSARYIDFNNREVTRPKNLSRLIARHEEQARAAAVIPTVSTAAVDDRLAHARALLAGAVLTRSELRAIEAAMGAAVTPATLAAAFQVVLELERQAPGTSCPPGGSRFGGTPDLPRGVRAPRGFAFLAQLDLEALSGWDLEGRLPAAGRLFVFVNDLGGGRAVFSTAPTVAGKANPKAAAPEPIRFVPRYGWEGADATYRLASALPANLRRAVEAALGGGITAARSLHCERALGAPLDLQMQGDAIWFEANEGHDDSESVEFIAQLGFGDGFVLVGALGGDLERPIVAFTGT